MAELNSHDYDSVVRKAENIYYLAFFRKCLPSPGLGKLNLRLHGPDHKEERCILLLVYRKLFIDRALCCLGEMWRA